MIIFWFVGPSHFGNLDNLKVDISVCVHSLVQRHTCGSAVTCGFSR